MSLQAVVDKEVSQLLTKQEAEEQLASLLQRREALQAERDGKQQQRAQLELQLMRFAEKTHSSALTEHQPASSQQAAAQEGEERSHQGQGSCKGSPVSDQRQGHFKSSPNDSLALAEQAEAEPNSTACLSPKQLSHEEEETRRHAAALGDAVDTCQAQLQYLDSSVAECKVVSQPWLALHCNALCMCMMLSQALATPVTAALVFQKFQSNS